MRRFIECRNEFRVGCSGCTLISDENGTCTAHSCMDCDVADKYIRRINSAERENNIPSISKKHDGIEYLSNLDGTIGFLRSVYDAFDMYTLFDYKPVGYSSAIVQRYPLFALLKTSMHLTIPDKIWYGGDIAPLIVEYNHGVYIIASKVHRDMIK